MAASVNRMRDGLVAAGLGIASFILLVINYWFPPEKIFDEVYFARAAEEYLQRRYIYESTHPPLTKLLITASVMLFGGLPGGDTSVGWRFLDVLAGAIAVVLCFLLAKRILRSTLFGAYAAALFGLDGMHFVQSRIATPESFVVCFSLATIYGFCRYWDVIAERAPETLETVREVMPRIVEGLIAMAIAAAFVLIRFPQEASYAKVVAGVAIAAALYAAYRIYRSRPQGVGWLLLFAFSGAALVASKWYGVMAYGVAAIVIAWDALGAWEKKKRSPFPLDLVIATSIAAIGIIYALVYIPHFLGLKDLPEIAPRAYTLTNVVDMQVGAYNYHAHLVATHPYASQWWEWPLDLRPVLYYAKYGNDSAAMIYSLPNPLLLWTGLLGVPFAAFLAYRTKDRGYALIVLAYLMQWLPWAKSPRLAWIYHFYVDIPLIAICNALAIQWIFNRLNERNRNAAIGIAAVYFAIIAGTFIYFYPVLAGVTISSAYRMQHYWLGNWWV